MSMSEEYPEFSEEIIEHIDEPFDGLFGNNVQTRVVEELAADPHNIFRPKDLEELTDASTPSIRKALNNLIELNLVKKEKEDSQHPLYKVNLDSNKLIALTFLSLALIDDKEDSDCMDQAIREYCIKEDLFPRVQANTEDYEIEKSSTTNYRNIYSESVFLDDKISGGA